MSGQDGQLIVRNGDLFGRKSGAVKEDVLYVDADDVCTQKKFVNPFIRWKGLSEILAFPMRAQ